MAKRALRGERPDLVAKMVDWCVEYCARRDADEFIEEEGGWVSYICSAYMSTFIVGTQ